MSTKTINVWSKDETQARIDSSIKGYDVPISQVTSLQTNLDNLQSQIDGQSKAFVLESTTDLKNWLVTLPSETKAKIGDNIYTTFEGTGDFWISAIDTSNPTYHIEIEGNEYESYYNLIPLQDETIDLTYYVKNLTGTSTNGVLTGLSKSGNTLTVSSTNISGSAGGSGYYIQSINQASNGKITATTAALPSHNNQKIKWNGTSFSDSAEVNLVPSGVIKGTVSGNTVTISADLSSKQDALNSTQLSAINSGVTSTTVAQVSTNKSNISTLTSSLNTTNTNVTSLTTRVATLESSKPVFTTEDGLTTDGILTITYTE